MRYLSVCSGIEAASVAWHSLGWTPVAFSEIEPFPCAVLAHHYPDVQNWGDMTKFKEWPDADVDVLIGGTPCQSFSVAGLRKGLADPRGNLALTYLAIADKYRPTWVVWENVPGVLSSGGGRDFAAFLGGLGELGYGWAYRVLDAQYFGVAQRRRRVFVVGCLGNWAAAAAVLFERESLQGHPAPSREAGKVFATLTAPRSGGGGSYRLDAHDVDGGFIQPVCPTLRAGGNQTGGDRPPGTDVDTADSLIVTHTLGTQCSWATEDGTGRGSPLVPVGVTLHGTDGTQSIASLTDLSSSLRSRIPSGVENSTTTAVMQPVTYDFFNITAPVNRQNRQPGDPCHTLARDNAAHAAVAQPIGLDEEQNACIDGFGTLKARMEGGGFEGSVMTTGMQVRRLTPVECERLQGFPDNYTAIPWRNKPADQCPDGPRYKALGNSMAVPVIKWLGERIQMVNDLLEET